MEADIEEITRMIWDSLFELALERGAEDRVDDSPTVTGLVQIHGAWHGAMMLRCQFRLASSLAAAMFQTEEAPGSDEVRDAVGELTNMLAGNVKALLPEHCSLSLPSVVYGDGFKAELVGMTRVASVPFVSAGNAMVVTLLQRLAGPAAE